MRYDVKITAHLNIAQKQTAAITYILFISFLILNTLFLILLFYATITIIYWSKNRSIYDTPINNFKFFFNVQIYKPHTDIANKDNQHLYETQLHNELHLNQWLLSPLLL